MKHLLTFLMLTYSYMLCGAQATSLTVDNQAPGWLSSKIGYGDQQTVENITITGYLNGTDFNFIAELNKLHNLRGKIDLSNCHIVSTTQGVTTNANTLNAVWFEGCERIDTMVLPESCVDVSCGSGHYYLESINNLIINCPNIEYVDFVGSNVYNVIIYDGPKTLNMGNAGAWHSVTWPSTLKSLSLGSKRWIDCKGLLTIYSKVLNPNDISAPVGLFPGDPSGLKVIKNARIVVPVGTKELYTKLMDESVEVVEDLYPESISIKYDNSEMYVGETQTLIAQILPHNSLHNEVKWNSSDSTIANIDNQGVVRGISFGECTISAITENGLSSEISISVFKHVESLSVPKTLSVGISQIVPIEAVLYPLGETNGKIIWETSDSNIAVVDKDGKVSGVSKGNCIITATTLDGGYEAKCEVTVIQPVESVSVSSKALSLNVGEMSSLSVSVLPYEADDKSISWLSTDISVANVSDMGMISAVSPGVAKIYAASNYNPEIRDFCEVTVVQPVTGIKLNKSELEIIEDESISFETTILPENATNKSVTWASSDVSIAMVSSDGTVYGIKPGQATIMATTVDGGFVALCKVTVKAKTVVADAIQLSPNSVTIVKGENLQLNVVLTPDNVSNKTVNWTSTNTGVATVDASGLVRAISDGKTQIIATTTDGSNLSAICEVTVENQFISVTKIEINPTSERIAKGKSVMLNAVITPEDASLKTVSWSSTNPGVATVSQNGEVTAVSEGNAIVIASTQDGSNLSAMCQITVYDESGVETILSDKNSYVKVFNLSGCLVYEGIYNDAKLIPGFYIVMCDGKSYKIKIE